MKIAEALLSLGKVEEAIHVLKDSDTLFYEIADELGELFSRNRIIYDILEERVQDRGNLIKAKRDLERKMIKVVVDVVRKYQD